MHAAAGGARRHYLAGGRGPRSRAADAAAELPVRTECADHGAVQFRVRRAHPVGFQQFVEEGIRCTRHGHAAGQALKCKANGLGPRLADDTGIRGGYQLGQLGRGEVAEDLRPAELLLAGPGGRVSRFRTWQRRVHEPPQPVADRGTAKHQDDGSGQVQAAIDPGLEGVVVHARRQHPSVRNAPGGQQLSGAACWNKDLPGGSVNGLALSREGRMTPGIHTVAAGRVGAPRSLAGPGQSARGRSGGQQMHGGQRIRSEQCRRAGHYVRCGASHRQGFRCCHEVALTQPGQGGNQPGKEGGLVRGSRLARIRAENDIHRLSPSILIKVMSLGAKGDNAMTIFDSFPAFWLVSALPVTTMQSRRKQAATDCWAYARGSTGRVSRERNGENTGSGWRRG
jgi:hypothetical protein